MNKTSKDTAVKDNERRITEKGAYRYYSTQRPVDIGTFPQTETGPVRFENFGSRRFVEQDQFMAWGYLVYDAPLSEKQIGDYELRPALGNSDLKEQMNTWAQIVGKWERAHHIPDVKRLTWWYPDFGAFVAKEFVTPEQLKKQYDGVVAANARAAGKRAVAGKNKKKASRGRGDAR